MCDTCGCGGDTTEYTLLKPGEKPSHDHSHPHTHGHHTHEHSHESTSKTIDLEQDVLLKNNLLAERNRGYFEAKHIKAINMVSSPGSGKTTLLEKTLSNFNSKKPCFVIEGDQQTTHDANRIQAAGSPVIQINTGSGCHLDAEMINNAVKKLELTDNSILFIENVGNLVCPAMFDLGESKRVVIISVTEGEDKALKYPYMFASSQLCVINKIDLLPYVDFKVDEFKKNALHINHHLTFIELSAKNGENLDLWQEWVLT